MVTPIPAIPVLDNTLIISIESDNGTSAESADTHDLLFKTDMVAGHGGRSGRLGSIEESAEIMGWLIAHARDGRLP